MLSSEEENAWLVDGVPTDFNKMVIVKLPLATFAWARLVRSHSTQPMDGVRVSVERVISLVAQATFEFQVTEDSVNDEQA